MEDLASYLSVYVYCCVKLDRLSDRTQICLLYRTSHAPSLSAQQTFPKDGERPAVSVQVSRTSTCEMVCEAIACILDVAEQRVVLKERQSGNRHPHLLHL